MATGLAVSPSGRVSDVYTSEREREGAYDFLESAAVRPTALIDAVGRACALRCESEQLVLIPLDGTSLTLVDRRVTKDFGWIGSSDQHAPGLNLIDAIAVSTKGIPLGVAAMVWWARPRQRKVRKQDRRPVGEKETQRWIDAIDATCARFAEHAPTTLCWFQIDREGDSWPVLQRLATSGHAFTVRSQWNRRLANGPSKLRDALRLQPVRGTYDLHISPAKERSERTARMVLRAAPVTLDMVDPRVSARHTVTVNAVWAQEYETTPTGERPIDWLLLTSAPTDTVENIERIVSAYSQRWRVEDFHRTWKRGHCNVEDTRLHATEHVIKWATLLAAAAMRIERLKHLARQEPERPATIELTRFELKALLVLKREQKKRNEVLSSRPTIAQATRWLADLGGYTGKSSGGPPGSTTIGRGLAKVELVAKAFAALAAANKAARNDKGK